MRFPKTAIAFLIFISALAAPGIGGGIVSSTRASSANASGASAEWDWAQYAARSPKERLDILLAGLRDRDSKLLNCEYLVMENDRLGPPDTGRVVFTKHFDVKRQNDKLWLHNIANFQFRTPSTTVETLGAWDGTQWTARSLQQDTWSGGIDKIKPDYAINNYSHMLGWSCVDVPNSSSVADWMEKSAANARENKVEVNVLSEAGSHYISFTLTTIHTYVTEEYIVDPNRGFVLLRHSCRYTDGPRFNAYKITTTSFDTVDGIDVPARVIQDASTSATPATSSEVYDLIDFQLNKVSGQDFAIQFPPGTDVINRGASLGYHVEQNGTKTPLRLYDPKVDRIIPGSTGISIDAGQ